MYSWLYIIKSKIKSLRLIYLTQNQDRFTAENHFEYITGLFYATRNTSYQPSFMLDLFPVLFFYSSSM